MNPEKETKNERYVKPEIQNITSLSDGLILHGDGTPQGEGGPGEGEGGQNDPNL